MDIKCDKCGKEIIDGVDWWIEYHPVGKRIIKLCWNCYRLLGDDDS